MRKGYIFCCFFVLGFLLENVTSAQTLELETMPASTKWKQIRTDNFNIIFPQGIESEANRVANIFETIHEPASMSLGVKPRRFRVVLQNQNAISNGFVTIGPRRSELFTTHSQNYNLVGNADWLEYLAVHEYRHMVQFEKSLQTPINKLTYLGFGEPQLGLGSAIASPSWYWEGDAVGIETSFTKTGRGRIPRFAMEFRSNILEKGGFDYNKQHLTSFRDFVPNHYRTGFFMTTYLKRKHGVDIWDKIIKRAYGFPYIPFAFSNAIKKETGSHLLETYKGMMSEMSELYVKQVEGIKTNNDLLVNSRQNNFFTNYDYPHLLDGGKVIALKNGFSDIDHFVLIDQNGNEESLFTTGIFNDPSFLSVGGGKVVWTEFEFDPRWLKRTYSVIKSFDIKTRTFKRLTTKTKYLSAAISFDGQKIAAIENTTDNLYSIHLIDFNTGSIVKVFNNPENTFYSMPSFSRDGAYVTALKHGKEEKSIVRININTGTEEILYRSEKENFAHPVLVDNVLYFNSPYNGIDNIYALDVSENKVYQITDSKLGAFNPSISKDQGKMIYNEFANNGMDIRVKDIDRSTWILQENVVDRNLNYAEPMVEAEGHSHVLDNIQDEKYEGQKYNSFKHLIRPYAWGVTVTPTGSSMIMGVNSLDYLSTLAVSAGLQYDSDEQNWLRFGTVSYQGFYPILDASIIDGTRSAQVRIDDALQSFDWNETTLRLGLRVPIVLTKSKFLQKLTLTSRSNFTSVSSFDLNENRLFIDQPGNGNLNSLEHSFRFVSRLRTSKLDLDSRFGQAFSVHLRHTPIGGDYNSTMFAAESDLFFPGLSKHHSFRVRGTYQHENSINYFFDSPIRFTRAIGYIPFRNFTNWSINYKLPLMYPDFHIGPLLNVQRIYANLFLDQGHGTFPSIPNSTLRSYGVEMSFNFNIMRFLLMFDVGFRYSRTYVSSRINPNDSRFQLIIGSVSL